MNIVQFQTFDAAQKAWQSLENPSTVYPFQQWWYLKLYTEHFCRMEDVLLLAVVDEGEVVAVGAFEKVGDTVLFLGMKPVLGKEEVTDYGGVLASSHVSLELIINELIRYFQKERLLKWQMDFVREDNELYDLVQKLNGVDVVRQEVAPFIRLAQSWDEYLTALPRVKRKELKRKIRRLEEEKSFHFCKEETFEQDFADFIKLHRLSSPDKEQFMSEPMQAFFWDLVTCDSYPWSHRFCFLEMNGKRVAAVLSFISDTQVLLYNSGFDPEFNFFSVGLILKAYVLKNAIEEGRKVYDFLRGNERYKYDMGGKDVILWRLTVTL